MRLYTPLLVAPGVYQLWALGAQVTALLEDDGVVLVDVGGRGSLMFIEVGLKALHRSLTDVRLIVLTHCHPDHVGSLDELAAAASAKVAAHRGDAGVISGEVAIPSPYRHPVVASVTRPLLPLFYGRPVRVDYLLEDGDLLPGTRNVQVLHTPGHTPGSICLYVASQRLLIVGDALTYRRGRLGPPASWVTQDSDQALESVKRLVDLDVDVICFSHYRPLRGNVRGAIQKLLQQAPL